MVIEEETSVLRRYFDRRHGMSVYKKAFVRGGIYEQSQREPGKSRGYPPFSTVLHSASLFSSAGAVSEGSFRLRTGRRHMAGLRDRTAYPVLYGKSGEKVSDLR